MIVAGGVRFIPVPGWWLGRCHAEPAVLVMLVVRWWRLSREEPGRWSPEGGFRIAQPGESPLQALPSTVDSLGTVINNCHQSADSR